MSKYDPLEDYLKQADDEDVPMGFSEIEHILGFELPPSSTRRTPHNSHAYGRHSSCQSHFS